MVDTLRECPFCGAGGIETTCYATTYIRCSTCGCECRKEVWNTRIPEESLRAQLKEAREALETVFANAEGGGISFECYKMIEAALSNIKGK